jgi:hypothetical protein
MTVPPAVSFTVNVCNSDAPFLEQTLRHMMRQLDFPFCERIVAYDPGRQTGKYTERIQGTQNEVERILEILLADRVIDRVDVIPWTDDEQNRILHTYFGDQRIDLKDFSGAPIYQYLYALDACRGDYVLHVDSDMLFYRAGESSWIVDGLALLKQQSRVVVATPKGGPPQARNWFERLTGRSFEAPPRSPWSVATFTSTRYFLMDVARFAACLPIMQIKSGEPLENSISHTFKLRGYERWTMNDYTHWAIHPWKHDENYIHHLDDLIWAVENSVYPFRRTGYRWDMRTEGRLIDEWLVELHKHGRGRG